MRNSARYLPASLFVLALVMLGAARPRSRPTLPSLQRLPREFAGYHGRDLTLSSEEERVAAVTRYLYRVFERDSANAFSVYVGYYDHQEQGRAIHSPKNCLPGAGWQPVAFGLREVALGSRSVQINRYLLANGDQRSLVYYWYQGRGRVVASEYLVKWNLFRDALLIGRTDEALVRIVIPLRVGASDADVLAGADTLGGRVSALLIPILDQALSSL